MDELVKALRETDFGDTCVLCEHEDMCKGNDCIIIQAADAIEELSKLALDEHNRAAVAAWERRWIPVTERLPEESGHYLICIECKCDGELFSAWMQVAWFCEKFYWENLHSDNPFREKVTHWMPLPQPPEED